jgi:hypothetical protein
MPEIHEDKIKIEHINARKTYLPAYIKDILKNPFKYCDGCDAKANLPHTADELYTFALNKLVPAYVSQDMRWTGGPGSFRVIWKDQWEGKRFYHTDGNGAGMVRGLENLKVRCEAEFDIYAKELPLAFAIEIESGKAEKYMLSPAFSLVKHLNRVSKVKVSKLGTLTAYGSLKIDEEGQVEIIGDFEGKTRSSACNDHEKIEKDIEILEKVLKKKNLTDDNWGLESYAVPRLYFNAAMELTIRNPTVKRFEDAAVKLRKFTDFYKENRKKITTLVQEIDCPRCAKKASSELNSLGMPRDIAEYL